MHGITNVPVFANVYICSNVSQCGTLNQADSQDRLGEGINEFFLDSLNRLNSIIQFTLELEKFEGLPFSDILFDMKGG